MSSPFGAVDLFSGGQTVSGTNNFNANKDPTNSLSTDTGQLASNPETMVSAMSDVFTNMPEMLAEIFLFLLAMPFEIIAALLGFNIGSGGSLLDGLCSMFTGQPQTGTTPDTFMTGTQGAMDNFCGLFTGQQQTGTTGQTIMDGVSSSISTGSQAITGDPNALSSGAALMSGGQGLADSMCGLFTGNPSQTGTNGSTVYAGTQSTIGTGSTVLTGDPNAIGSGTGLMGGGINLMNLLCSMCTGGLLIPERRLRTGSLPTPITNGAAIAAGVQGWIGTASNHLTGNPNTLTSGQALATSAQGQLDTAAALVGGTGTGNTFTDVMSQGAQYQADSLAIIGNPTGLGSGNPVVPPIYNIPLLGQQEDVTSTVVVDALTSTSWFNDLQGVLGNPTGLGTGSVTIPPGVNDVPLLAPAAAFQQGVIDYVYGGLTGVSTVGNSAASLGNAAGAIAKTAKTAATQAQTGVTYVELMAVNQQGHHAVDPSLVGVFDLTTITGSSPDTVAVTELASSIGFIHMPAGATKSSVAFIGVATPTGLTAAYVSVYSVNTTTGEMKALWTSANVIGSIGTASYEWVYISMPPITVTQGQWLAAELAVVGGGSITLVGLPNHYLGPNFNVFPRQLGASRITTQPVLDIASTFAGTGSITSGSWSHFLNAMSNAAFVILNVANAGAAETVGVTVGGVPATQRVVFPYDSPPVPDAVGPGFISTTPTTAFDNTFIHTALGGAAVLVAMSVVVSGAGIGTYTRSVTYGGVAMNSLGFKQDNNAAGGWTEVFGLLNVPAGPQTVEMQISGSATVEVVVANSESYMGVTTFGAQVTASGSSTTPASGTITSSPELMVFNAFGAKAATAFTSSGYTQTQRYNHSAATGAFNNNLTMGEAPGTTSVTFGETLSTTVSWSSVSIPLVGNVGQAGYLCLFELDNPPTGLQTIAFTLSAAALVSGVAVSYEGSGITGSAVITAAGTGVAPTQTITAAQGQILLQAFANDVGNGNLTGYSQTQLGAVGGTANNQPLLVGQAVASGTAQTFGATGANQPWGSFAIGIASPFISAPASIPSPPYSNNVPWLALSSENVTTEGTFAPTITPYLTPGTYTYVVPFWVTYLDLVGIGAGGDGAPAGFFSDGPGGSAGKWTSQTIQRAVDFKDDPNATITIVVGAPEDGSRATTISWTDPSNVVHTLTGAGGITGSVGVNGQRAPNFVFDGENYFGGAPATSPGGGGIGAFLFVLFSQPTAGGGGSAWLTARAVPGPSVVVQLPTAISGRGQLSAQASIGFIFPGHGMLTGVPAPRNFVSKTVTGHGLLTATGGRLGKLTGHGVLSATVKVVDPGTGSPVGHGSLHAVIGVKEPTQLHGRGVLLSGAIIGTAVTAGLHSQGQLTAGAGGKAYVNAALSGTGRLVGTGSAHGMAVGHGVLSATRIPTNYRFGVNLPGTGALSGPYYSRIPAPTPLPGTGVLLPITYPTYDVAAPGYSAGVPTSTLQWNQVNWAGNTVYAWVSVDSNATVLSVTFGGVAMTRVATLGNNNTPADGSLFLYSLSNAAHGTHTVFVTLSTNAWCSGSSVTYASTLSLGSITTSYGFLANPSQAMTCGARQLIIQGFSAQANTFTGFSGGNGRYASATGNNSGSLLILDSSTSATFTATLAATPWAAIGAVLS